MPVSYVSDIIKSNPFIQPFDINLMAKVNGYLQSQFYKNANKLENQIGQLNNADVANEEQRNYLKSKVNNLVLQIDNMGAMNYADINVSNTLDNYATGIYTDENVIRGISSTKMIRALQSNYQQMKSNPKTMKYYNIGNEAYDNRAVNDYINGGFYAEYNGKTTPALYNGNPWTRLKDAIKQVMPDVTVEFTDAGNPFFIEQRYNKRVDADKVYAAIQGSIDPDLINQIHIDSWYTMQGLSPDKTKQLYVESVDNKRKQLQGLHDYYTNLATISPEGTLRKKYESDVEDINTRIKELDVDNTEYNIDKKIQTPEGLEEVWAKVYRDGLFDNVIKAMTYNDESGSKLIINQQSIWQAKQLMAASKLAKEKAETDVLQGLGELGYNTQTEEQTKAQNVTLGTYTAKNTELEKENTNEIREWITELASTDPTYRSLLGSQKQLSGISSQAPVTFSPIVLDAVSALDGKSETLSLKDLALAGNIASPSSGGSYSHGPTVEELEKLGINKQQQEFFQKTSFLIDAASTGKISQERLNDMRFDKKQFISLVNNVRFRNMAVAANSKYVNTVLSQATDNLNLTKEEKAKYKQYLVDISSGVTAPYMKVGQGSVQSSPLLMGIGGHGEEYTELTELGKEIDNIGKKLGETMGGRSYKIDKEIQKILDNDENRLNYYGSIIANNDALKKVGIDIGKWVGNSGNPNRPEDLGSVENIIPTDVRRDETTNQWVIHYQYRDKNNKTQFSNSKTSYVVPPALVAKLGLADRLPHPELEDILKYQVDTTPLYVYNPVIPNGVFKFDIVRTGNSRNPKSVNLRIYNDDGKVTILKQGYGGRNFRSANEAYSFMENMIKPEIFSAEFNNSREDFFTRINKPIQ